MSCIVCRKADVRLFSVGINYGTINHTVGDDLVEIFGDKVSLHLTPESLVCNVCMNILDNMAKLIKNIWLLISNPCHQPEPGHMGKLWKIFASLKLEGDDYEEMPSSRIRTPTPSKLLKPLYSEPYRRHEEDKIAERERLRSMSRATSYYSQSEYSDSEVRKLTRRRKKKGHNWTRPKRGRPKSVDSFSSPRRPLSSFSYCSTKTPSGRSPVRKKPIVEYDSEGRLMKKRTRSISRAQDEEEKIREEMEESRFYCREKECTLYFKDLEVLNLHNILDHEQLALFYCEECQQKYTSSHHLKLHMKIHDNSSFYCLMCASEMQNRSELQKHLDEHMIYSVPCKYCDKSFLDKTLCNNHIKTAHRGRKNREIRRVNLIIDRLDTDSGISEKENNCNSGEELRVEYMYYTDMEYESDDVDVTEENLKMRNIDFFVYDDSQSNDSDSASHPPAPS